MEKNAEKMGNKYLVLLTLVCTFTFTFITRYIWNPLAPSVVGLFNMNEVQSGLYMSAFFVGYLITQIPGGIMADKLKPRYMLIVTTALGGLMTAAMSMITSYNMGIIIRVISGLSGGCTMACCSKILAQYFEGKERVTSLGVLLSSPPIGIMLANNLGSILNGIVGWKVTFVIVGMVSILVILMLLFFIRERPIPASMAGGKTKVGLFDGLSTFLKDPLQVLLGCSGFFFMWVSIGFATTTGGYLAKTMDISPPMIITIYSISGVIGSSLSGTIATKLKLGHREFLRVALVIMAIMTYVFSIQKTVIGLIIVSAIYGFCSFLPSTHYTSLSINRAGAQYAATASSTQNLMFQLAGLIQPVVVGMILDSTGNYQYVWLSFVFVLVVAFVITLLIKNEKEAPSEIRIEKTQIVKE